MLRLYASETDSGFGREFPKFGGVALCIKTIVALGVNNSVGILSC